MVRLRGSNTTRTDAPVLACTLSKRVGGPQSCPLAGATKSLGWTKGAGCHQERRAQRHALGVSAQFAPRDSLLYGLQEEAKTLPFGAVWDRHCETKGVPVGEAWLSETRNYEGIVLGRRAAAP